MGGSLNWNMVALLFHFQLKFRGLRPWAFYLNPVTKWLQGVDTSVVDRFGVHGTSFISTQLLWLSRFGDFILFSYYLVNKHWPNESPICLLTVGYPSPPLGLPGLHWYPAPKEFIPRTAGHPENLIQYQNPEFKNDWCGELHWSQKGIYGIPLLGRSWTIQLSLFSFIKVFYNFSMSAATFFYKKIGSFSTRASYILWNYQHSGG